jgi:hypothetical protein
MSEPNKATLLAHMVDVKPSGSKGNIVKDIVFLDKKGNPVDIAYTDAKAVAAVKAKSQIAALTTLETSADLQTTVQKVNEVIAALKA